MNMPTKQPAKKTKPTTPAKGKKIKADASRLDKKGGGDSKNATGG
jgi:hypothetical protein